MHLVIFVDLFNSYFPLSNGVFLLSSQMARCYVVFIGRLPGVYDHWEDCVKQVTGFRGNYYKGYITIAAAETRWFTHLEDLRKEKQKKTLVATVSLSMFAMQVYWFLA